MATIYSLPPELLHRILEPGSLWPSSLWDPPRESYDFLLSASLVSRTWRAVAQERLWRRVHLGNKSCANAFVRSGGGGVRQTVELTLRGATSGQLATRSRVINTCVGLERVAAHILCWDNLSSPAVAGITSLSTYCLEEGSLPREPLPFRLTHLLLFQLPSPTILDVILQPSITSLSIWPSSVTRIHLPSFIKISHQLTYLQVFSLPSTNFRLLEPFFCGCINLSHLSINTLDLHSLLPLIPRALENLTCHGLLVDDLQALLDRLRSTPPASIVALSSLRRLRLDAEERSIVTTEEGRKLLEECEAKGIRVEFEVLNA